MGLPAGEYRLFAVRDQDGDGLYQEERDALGTTTHPIVVHADSPTTVQLRLGAPRDRTPPQLSDVRPVSQRRVWLEWSEPLDPASLRAEGFAFADSAGADTVAVRAAVQVPQRPTVVELVSERALEPNRRYAVLVRPGSVRDTAGNVLVQAPQPLSFRPVPTPDTQAVRLWTVPGDSARGVGLDEVLELFADAAMDTAALECTVQTAQGVPVPIVQEAVQQNRWRIRPQQRWQPDEWHLLQLRWRTAAALDGRSLRDTLLRVAFRTLDPRTCGELRGELLDSLGCSGPYVLQLYDRAGKGARRLPWMDAPCAIRSSALPFGRLTRGPVASSAESCSIASAAADRTCCSFTTARASCAAALRWSIPDNGRSMSCPLESTRWSSSAMPMAMASTAPAMPFPSALPNAVCAQDRSRSKHGGAWRGSASCCRRSSYRQRVRPPSTGMLTPVM